MRAGLPAEVYLLNLDLSSGREATEAAVFLLSNPVGLNLQPSSTNHALSWELIAYTDLLGNVNLCFTEIISCK
jgi:hypothetical protein